MSECVEERSEREWRGVVSGERLVGWWCDRYEGEGKEKEKEMKK